MLSCLIGHLATQSLKALSVIPRKMFQGLLRSNRSNTTRGGMELTSAFETVWPGRGGVSQSTTESHRLWTCPQSDYRWGAWPPVLIKSHRSLLTIDCWQYPRKYWLKVGLLLWLPILMSQVSPASHPSLSNILSPLKLKIGSVPQVARRLS